MPYSTLLKWISRFTSVAVLATATPIGMTYGGPANVSDDPEPTDYKHVEIYIFGNGTSTHEAHQIVDTAGNLVTAQPSAIARALETACRANDEDKATRFIA